MKEVDAESEYCQWLRDCYDEAWTKLLLLLVKHKTSVQIQAVSTLMKLVCQEAKHPYVSSSTKKSFPLKRLKLILLALLSSEKSMSLALSRFQEFTEKPNVFYFVWSLLPNIARTVKHPNQIFIKNFLDLVSKVPVPKTSPKTKEKDAEATESLVESEETPFEIDMQHIHGWLNKVWNHAIRWKHSRATQKQLLVLLLESFLVHLKKPILLTDYLMDCMDMGGPISLLALQGIFTLIQNHNIEYPNIYTKLYSLFNAEVFQMKYKARLFFLADVFLSSTHLSAHLVAAFAKRLSRLCLVAPPQDIKILLAFVGNLILRHPELKKLIHHPIGGEVSCDPFVADEADPLKSRAMDSSLWEVASMQHHVLPGVASAAKFINTPLPSVEWDMHALLESSEDDIFDKEAKKKAKEVMLTFERPTSIALPRGEKMLQFWSITET
ncbi:nucleolar complex protein 4 homolog B isoform X2 [Bacillus rossius redtenbacheri]|uniref:nucleolar complex protein 4 homolog B isoform X2 n=1 Tax=Bacillus rossius redtenbacheri TaxID=93214 RepID=UPI002FDD05B2